ncbi:hypothetical protein Bca52824_006631 [Brassica carinata]|uniref:Uncharacterized protein n=1 Tax=Brassica carinata TaxID=52824 RepID=A0A8X8B737_BRACI|nr:hypothetical protein Bca52824_006631 [Brassica carinata]
MMVHQNDTELLNPPAELLKNRLSHDARNIKDGEFMGITILLLDEKVEVGKLKNCSSSWDDLQKLWYVLLKEMLQAQNMMFPNPDHIQKLTFVEQNE